MRMSLRAYPDKRAQLKNHMHIIKKLSDHISITRTHVKCD